MVREAEAETRVQLAMPAIFRSRQEHFANIVQVLVGERLYERGIRQVGKEGRRRSLGIREIDNNVNSCCSAQKGVIDSRRQYLQRWGNPPCHSTHQEGAHRLGPLLGHLIHGVHGAAVQRDVGEVRAQRRDPLRVLVDHVARVGENERGMRHPGDGPRVIVDERRMVPARRQGGQLTVIDSMHKNANPYPVQKGA